MGLFLQLGLGRGFDLGVRRTRRPFERRARRRSFDWDAHVYDWDAGGAKFTAKFTAPERT
jgi:hypothetical protein